MLACGYLRYYLSRTKVFFICYIIIKKSYSCKQLVPSDTSNR